MKTEEKEYNEALTERILAIRQDERQDRREWIENEVNRGSLVLIACTYANIGLIGAYLTTSGQVCREEFGYIDDVEDPDEFDTYNLPRMTWSSIKRMQNYLIKYQE